MDFLIIENETEEVFEKIAQILFDKYAIQNHNSLYRLIEIEFYWHSTTHKDNSTYKRNHVDPNSGEWFFHYSGVDIALKNEKTGGHGGILIRGIYDIVKKKSIKGPMVCAMKLFSGFNAFTSHIKTKIIPYEFDKCNIMKKTRFGLGQNAKENGADKLNYAFFINPEQ
jgi:hypothetical protein